VKVPFMPLPQKAIVKPLVAYYPRGKSKLRSIYIQNASLNEYLQGGQTSIKNGLFNVNLAAI